MGTLIMAGIAITTAELAVYLVLADQVNQVDMFPRRGQQTVTMLTHNTLLDVCPIN